MVSSGRIAMYRVRAYRAAVTVLAAATLLAAQTAMTRAHDPVSAADTAAHRLPTPVLPVGPPRVAIPPALPKIPGSVPVRPPTGLAPQAAASAKMALRALVIAT